MRVKDVESILFRLFPREDAEPWDNVGLSVGNPAAKVVGIACALDARPKTIRAARAAGCNVLVTHHPAWLKAPDPITPSAQDSSLAGATAWEAISQEVSLIAMHTNLDRSPMALALVSQITGLKSLGTTVTPDGFGIMLDAPGLTVDEVAGRMGDAFGAIPTVWGPGEAPAGTVGFCSGSLGDMGEAAIAAGCHTVVSGECGYHHILEILEAGCAAILLGHDVSEIPYAALLTRELSQRVDGIPVTTLEQHVRWHLRLPMAP